MGIPGSGFRVDVVVAVRDEEPTLQSFVASLDALDLPEECDLGVIFVEDSSRDATRALLERMSRERPEIGYYALAKGFGQGPAIIFGASQSDADAIIMMDVDGGHPVDAIPEMIRAHQAGAQVVQCVRHRLVGRTAFRRFATSLFHLILRLLVGADFRLYSIYYRLVTRDVFDQCLTMPRYWHYLRFPLPTGPTALQTVEVDAADRTAGQSKYGIRRLLGLGADGIVSLLTPTRLAGWVVGALVAAAIVIGLGAWPLAVPIVGLAIALVLRSRRLDRFALLERVSVDQSSPRRARQER